MIGLLVTAALAGASVEFDAAKLVGKPIETAIAVYGERLNLSMTKDGVYYFWRRETPTEDRPLRCEVRMHVNAKNKITGYDVKGAPGACVVFEKPKDD